jgi:hypothetical protein
MGRPSSSASAFRTSNTGGNRADRMYASAWYRYDPAWLQGWSGLFDDLFHGPELSKLTLVFLPPFNWYWWDISDQCGRSAQGCYDPVTETLYAPGERLSDGTRMETVIAHEYGHHIEANRSTAPWDSNATGPKRWASQMNICARAEAGQVFPGDEGVHYTLNPGEGFAEAYRLTVYNAYIWRDWTKMFAGPNTAVRRRDQFRLERQSSNSTLEDGVRSDRLGKEGERRRDLRWRRLAAMSVSGSSGDSGCSLRITPRCCSLLRVIHLRG